SVDTTIAAAIAYAPTWPNSASSTAVATRSCGAVPMADTGNTVKYATFASTYSTVTVVTPSSIAYGRSRLGSRNPSSPDPTLFHASIAKSAPTIAAPSVGRIETSTPPAGQNAAPKFAAATPSRQPSPRPSTISAASANTLIDVSTVCSNAATRTPRTLIHVS